MLGSPTSSATSTKCLVRRLLLSPIFRSSGSAFVYSPAVVNVRERIARADLGKIYHVDSKRVNLGLHQF